MAHRKQLEKLKQGVVAWNNWREVQRERVKLSGLLNANLTRANLTRATLSGADLSDADLTRRSVREYRRPDILTSNRVSATHPLTRRSQTSGNALRREAPPGELLSLLATGLGPTRPGVDSGKPFPSGALSVVTSAVEVRVNGTPAEVLGAVGLPGAVDGYQVNFRLPADKVHTFAHWQKLCLYCEPRRSACLSGHGAGAVFESGLERG